MLAGGEGTVASRKIETEPSEGGLKKEVESSGPL